MNTATNIKSAHGYTIAFGIRCEQERDALAAALVGVMGLVQLLTARDELRVERDAILSNYRYIEAERILAKLGAEYQPIDASGHPVRS